MDGRVFSTMVVCPFSRATANDRRAISRSSASRTRASSWSTASSVRTHNSATSAALPAASLSGTASLPLSCDSLPLDGRGRELEVEHVVDVLERPVLDGTPTRARDARGAPAPRPA